MKTRVFSEEVLKWVRMGWIPMEEQELMRGLFYEGEFQTLVKLGEKRTEEEKVIVDVEGDEETAIESSDENNCVTLDMQQGPLSLKRPEETIRVEEDVESFFDEVEQQQPRKEPMMNPIVKQITSPSKRMRVDSPPQVDEEVFIPEEEHDHVPSVAVEEMTRPKSQTPENPQNQVVEVAQEMSQSDSVHSSGKGKRFKKNNIKRITMVTPLQPYRM